MYMKFALLLLICFGIADQGTKPPPPTPEIQALVQQQGSDQWEIREFASDALLKSGWVAITALEEGTKSGDLEIARRSQYTLARFYLATTSDIQIPSIWRMPTKIRHPKPDIDLALEYYEQALNAYNLLAPPDKRLSSSYWHWEIAEAATQQFVADLLHYKVVEKKDITEFLDKMNSNKELRPGQSNEYEDES